MSINDGDLVPILSTEKSSPDLNLQELENQKGAAGGQSHYREVPRWEIFMEQELRFGLDFGQLALLKKRDLGRL